jgi:hypothetical protein
LGVTAIAGADQNNDETTRTALDIEAVLGAPPAPGGGCFDAGRGPMYKRLVSAIPALAIVLVASPSSHTAVAAVELAAQAIVARDAFACQSPWQVLERRDCHKLPAGTAVEIVSGDQFFACVVWPGTQRCMWIARDMLRKP